MPKQAPIADRDPSTDILGPVLSKLNLGLRESGKLAHPVSLQTKDGLDAEGLSYVHLFDECEEIANLLVVIWRILQADASLTPAIDEINSRNERRTYTPETEEGQILNQRHSNLRELSVLLKALHEWVNHIHVILSANQRLYRSVESDIRRRIANAVLVRDKLLTHKDYGASLIPGSGYSFNLATFRFMRMNMNLGEEEVSEIARLFNELRPHLPDELRSEENTYERYRLLTEHHIELRGELQARVRKLVEVHGGESPSIIEIARLCEDFVAHVVRPLAGRVSVAIGG